MITLTPAEKILGGLMVGAAVVTYSKPRKKHFLPSVVMIGSNEATNPGGTLKGIGLTAIVIASAGLIAQGYYANDKKAKALQKIPFGTIATLGAASWAAGEIWHVINFDAIKAKTLQSYDDEIDRLTKLADAGDPSVVNQTNSGKAILGDVNILDKANEFYNNVKYGPPWFAKAFDPQNAGAIIGQMGNDLDLARLIKAFGYRKHYLFGFFPSAEWTLPEFVERTFPKAEIADVNSINKSFGMNYQF